MGLSAAQDGEDPHTPSHIKSGKLDNLCYALLKCIAKGSPVVSLDSDHISAETGTLEELSKF